IVLDTTQCCCSSVPTSVPPPRFALLQDPATPKIYTLSLHDALPIYPLRWLRGSPRSPGLESLERLEERCGAESRELSPKRPRGVAPGDGQAALEQHGAGVETRVHLHDRDAGFGIPRKDRPLDGGGAAPARQDRRVNVDAPEPWERQHLSRKNEAVGHNDESFRIPGLKRRTGFLARERLGLDDRQAVGERGTLHRTRLDPAAATAR